MGSECADDFLPFSHLSLSLSLYLNLSSYSEMIDGGKRGIVVY